MADVISIEPADLRAIESSLRNISGDLQFLDGRVDVLDGNIQTTYNKLYELAKKFEEYVRQDQFDKNMQFSQTKLVEVRQTLTDKFGHYGTVRRQTTGILQATDLGIVRKDTISFATEETMISTPGYWLAPCLVGLAAWINNDREMADKAVKEAINRNDEKTSLFFALVCRRAGRIDSSLKWAQRYLENQDEENLDRNSIIILDAYASGLLGNDADGIIAKTIGEWLDNLAEKPGFVEKQTTQWTNALNVKRQPLGNQHGYVYLPKHSKTWPKLKHVMEGANLHAIILDYFLQIYSQEPSNKTLVQQLDQILDSLVTDFDNEELPLRQEERFNQLVIDYKGDTERAQKVMDVEKSAFEESKDFTQLLTDAAMNPENANASVSTQKFAIALTKDWINDAYSDMVAKNRMDVPNEIEIEVNGYKDKTRDGENENQIINGYDQYLEQEKDNQLAQNVLTSSDNMKLYGAIGAGVLALIFLIFGNFILAIIGGIGAVWLYINYNNRKKTIEQNRQQIQETYQKNKEAGEKLIRALMAEVADFRRQFAEKDAESVKVFDFLEQLGAQDYKRKLPGSTRGVIIDAEA